MMVPTSTPVPPSWADFPAKAREEIAQVEAELDDCWPGWRQKLRFDKVDFDLKFRIKGLLKKHMLLTRREGGAPAPRYWDVLVVRDGRDKNKCYAHPIMPKGHTEGSERFSERASRDSVPRPLPAPRPCEGLPTLAFRLKAPLEVLEALAQGAPDDLQDDRALEEWLEQTLTMLRFVDKNPSLAAAAREESASYIHNSIVSPKVSE